MLLEDSLIHCVLLLACSTRPNSPSLISLQVLGFATFLVKLVEPNDLNDFCETARLFCALTLILGEFTL